MTYLPIAQQRVLDALNRSGGTYKGISALARDASPNHFIPNIQRHAAAVRNLERSGLVSVDTSAIPYIIKAVAS